MGQRRLNPEKLLRRIQDEERKEQRGKLKIYLGAAPGVGKTHSMLEDARQRRAEGLDVIIGIVESHGRQEIETLLKQFDILPRQQVEYHGKNLLEFDLDAALKRNPGLILIDEMAHTNVPGLRHDKRWQDIKEILDRGIDVYTTLNVQHIESLSDDVAQIIHSRINETVPDSMIETADTLELVDIPPEELLKRLKEGKVYFPATAELARDNFFRKGNLIALRELALRVTAERVGAQVMLYRQGEGIRYIWPSKDKILVCVGPGPEAIKLIHTAKRIATSLQIDWIAVYVDNPHVGYSEQKRNDAIQSLRAAERLGAETRIIAGADVVKEIINFSHDQNVTQIMIWRKVRPRWQEFFVRSFADEMLRQSGEIDVYVITGTAHPTRLRNYKDIVSWKAYSLAIGVVAVVTLIALLLYPILRPSTLMLLYILGVTFVSLFARIGPAFLSSVLSALAYDFFFLPPHNSLYLADLEYFFSVILMFVVMQIISYLTIVSTHQAESARIAEQRTAALHTLSRRLASARGVDKLLQIGLAYIAEVFDSDALVLLPEDDHLEVRARFHTNEILNSKEEGIAQWVFELGQNAGLGTDTLSFSNSLYLPLLGSQGTIGVLRVHPAKPGDLLVPGQIRLLESCANQIALALEVDRIHEQASKSELRSETDRVRSALLKSVSHDIRAPLVSVFGLAGTLMEMGDNLDARQVKKISKDIYFEVEQLNRLINNLLQVSYLETESVKLQKESSSLIDIINMVLQVSNKKLGKRDVNLDIADDLPPVMIDSTLIQEVLLNLLDNAVKFTPPDSAIDISAQVKNNHVIVCINDRGPGIMSDEINKLFEKFYRGRMLTSERGLGLGLAICQRIVKAHGGKIWAENREQGNGAKFCFTLPV